MFETYSTILRYIGTVTYITNIIDLKAIRRKQ